MLQSHKLLLSLDRWIRRKLRCYRIKQCKRTYTFQQFLEKMGVKKWLSWLLALLGKGLWRKSGSPQAQQAMGIEWFAAQGIYSLALNYAKLNYLKKSPCARACRVV